MIDPRRTCILPNGLAVAAINATDARILYDEVFAADTYWQHGIALRDGDTVFDVGANIGLFTLFLDARHARLDVHAFEPIPVVHAALRANVASCARSNVTTHPFGLSRRDGHERFVFDRFLSYAGSSHLRELQRLLPRGLGGRARGPWLSSAWVDSLLAELGGRGAAPHAPATIGTVAANFAVERDRRPAARTLGRTARETARVALLGLLLVRRALFLRRVSAEVRTLSRVKRELGTATVDLVKIDVEGAELDVLLGVHDQDWPSIRQLVIEVHDVDGRVRTCRELLGARGFTVAVEHEPRPARRLLGIHHLFARRGG